FSAAVDGERAGTGSVPPTQAAPAAARRTNLPAELPMLYGRDSELQTLGALLAAHRLVTVVGAGGIGKSRLAQAVGHDVVDRYRHGSWMVELAGLADPALLPKTIAGALEIQIEGPGTADESLIAAIAGKSMLLILDNCEHLLEAVS